MSAREPKAKRNYGAVTVQPRTDGFGVFLDDRQAITPKGSPLTAPTEALALAVADEWSSQKEFIVKKSMPLTALMSVSIDSAEADRARWADEIIKYLSTDLVCYRADKPEALVQRQMAAWDPYLDWFRKEFGAELSATTGIIAKRQPAATLEKIKAELAGISRERLLGVKTATAILGSTVLASALWKTAFSPDALFEASRTDERFQEEKWGVDADAKAREEYLKEEFRSVSKFLSLL